MRQFYISPHTLSLFNDCPRCFWFHMIKGDTFKRPEGPTSTLPRGMDGLIKRYFDEYREQKKLPPEIANVVKGELVDKETVTKWRYWKTGLQFLDADGQRLGGALDDCLVDSGLFIPIDYKTRGYDLKDNSTSYYVLQLSCYNFLLYKNGYNTTDYAYLVFYIPNEIKMKGLVQFNVEIKMVHTLSLAELYKTFRNALGILSLNDPPLSANECKFCNWAVRVCNHQHQQLKLF